jgi:hypothetical protein
MLGLQANATMSSLKMLNKGKLKSQQERMKKRAAACR